MSRRQFVITSLIAAAAVCGAPASAVAATDASVVLRVMTHDSFDLPKELLEGFENQNGVKLELIKGGDAGEMVNKLVLTKANPVADVAYGIDNTLMPRAMAAGIVEPYAGPAALRKPAATMADAANDTKAPAAPAAVVPVDYGYVTLNVDKAWFAKQGLALPGSLQELTTPKYAKLLVVEHPATSSPGQAFVMATIAGMGEQAAFDWWAKMRANGVKVVKGWSEAYYTEFSRNGGAYPIVVSYASSPAAEVFYSKEKIEVSPTANLFLQGGVFRQVEGVALIKGGNPQAREAGGAFIEFMRSAPVQEALQTTMWMFPAESGAKRVEVMRQHASEPERFDNPTSADMNAKAKTWVQRWVKTVLK
ncbi:thiamine ABC transporter substrate-binding protein [Hydrogenophaga sp. 5NK40-0174]|uniref:thiamine ABC transporter substrate-binding protein n=1 Tax=Hydrogenophaga sp. 5NK40-0174 TaxID=3127649 RepID=UPI00310C236A